MKARDIAECVVSELVRRDSEWMADKIELAIEAAFLSEREACAKIAETFLDATFACHPVAQNIAAQIRNRKD